MPRRSRFFHPRIGRFTTNPLALTNPGTVTPAEWILPRNRPFRLSLAASAAINATACAGLIFALMRVSDDFTTAVDRSRRTNRRMPTPISTPRKKAPSRFRLTLTPGLPGSRALPSCGGLSISFTSPRRVSSKISRVMVAGVTASRRAMSARLAEPCVRSMVKMLRSFKYRASVWSAISKYYVYKRKYFPTGNQMHRKAA